MNIQVSYYKTANGEGYFHLPRRFDCKSGTLWEFDIEKKAVAGQPAEAGTNGKKTDVISRDAVE